MQSDAIGSLSSIHAQSQASLDTSQFGTQISSAIQSSVSSSSGQLNIEEAVSKLELLSASCTSTSEKAACENAIQHVQFSGNSLHGDTWSSKQSDAIAGTALAAALNSNPNTTQFAQNVNFSEGLQVSLNGISRTQPSSATHLFAPQPIDSAQATTDRPHDR